jgi:ADP-ribosylglycohydrolase
VSLPTRLDRYRGALLGLAAGDALGTTLEFTERDAHPPLTGMAGGGPFRLKPGEWTDDTSMALCLAESLIETGDFDPADQMRRYGRWRRTGHLSSNGTCFDIGRTVSAALGRFRDSGDPFSGSTDPQSAGSGSLMRLAPVPLFYARDVERAVTRAAESSRTTHGATEAVDACRYMAVLIVMALEGATRAELLSPTLAREHSAFAAQPLAKTVVAAVAEGPTRRREGIRASGYVLHSLEAALWAFATSQTFSEGALLAVNLGEDADTTGAVYGQLAGAFYGVDAIPSEWRRSLAHRPRIETMADRLFALAEG